MPSLKVEKGICNKVNIIVLQLTESELLYAAYVAA